MKASTKKLLNDQIKLIVKELEQVDDIADRVELRIKAVQAIYNISCHDLEDIVPQGKDSIRETKAKEPIIEEPVEDVEKAEEVEEIIVEENEPKEVSIDDIVSAGADLEPEVAANQAVELEQEELDALDEPFQIIVRTEDGENIDVTEEYNVLNPEISDDFRREYALQIKEYGTLETYKTLSFIEESDDEIIGYKNLVAYWIDTCELDTIEYYINYFASNIEIDEETGEETYVSDELHLDFLNNNNIKGFTEYVESILEE